MATHSIFLVFPFFFLLIQQQSCLQLSSVVDDGFVRTNGIQLTLNGAPLYANGFNAYWLMDVASDPSQRYKVTWAFQQAASNSLVIGRTWAFSDGGSKPLQSSPGVYHKNMFEGLDYVISEARKFGLKLILSLVNNFNDYGGKAQYIQWAKERGRNLENQDAFFTDPMVKGFFRNHIKTILTRRNTITGLVYKDDPTIMTWELMNEPRCLSDTSGSTLQKWISEMGRYLKSVDGNHLLQVGLEGFYGPSSSQNNPNNSSFGTDFIANNKISQIDVATVHSYPDQWLPNQNNLAQLDFLQEWIDNHVKDAHEVLQKPVIFAEFGKQASYNVSQRDQLYDVVFSSVYRSATTNGAAAGALFWQLQVQGMDAYKDGFEVILSEPSSTVTLISQQARKLSFITRSSLTRKSSKTKAFAGNKMGGLSATG